MARDFTKKQLTPLAGCVRRLNKKPALTAIPEATSTTTAPQAEGVTATATTSSPQATPMATTTSVPKKKGRPSKPGSKGSTANSATTTRTIGTTPTSIQTAWEKADQAADDFFAQTRGAAELDALYEVAANAQVHARAELKLNENERWWWRDSIPSAASPGGKKKASSEGGGDSLECHECYSTLEVEKDVEKHERRDAIIRVSQETLILRYAATVLRQKAREWAARRVASTSASET